MTKPRSERSFYTLGLALCALVVLILLVWDHIGAPRSPGLIGDAGPSDPAPSVVAPGGGGSPSVARAREEVANGPEQGIAEQWQDQSLTQVAQALDGRLLRCPLALDSAGRPLLDQPLGGQLADPPVGFPSAVVGRISGGVLEMLIPRRAGQARVALSGVGELNVYWEESEVDDPGVCRRMAWLGSAVGVYGVVVDSSGRPLDAATVSGCGARVETDEEGGFFVFVSDDGPCALVAVFGQAGLHGTSEPVEIAPVAGQDIQDVELVVQLRRAAALTDEQRRVLEENRAVCAKVKAMAASHPGAGPEAASLFAEALELCMEAERILAP